MNNIIEDYWSDDYGYVEVLYLNGEIYNAAKDCLKPVECRELFMIGHS